MLGAGLSTLQECGKQDEKPASQLSAQWTKSLEREGEPRKNPSKLKEPCGNVYENKGWLGETRGQSGNVIENKMTYLIYPGML
jgi:hypothetical protein